MHMGREAGGRKSILHEITTPVTGGDGVGGKDGKDEDYNDDDEEEEESPPASGIALDVE